MKVEDAHDFDKVMPMYNLIEYNGNYSKAYGILWQYLRNELTFAANSVTDFTVANSISDPFKVKQKVTGETDNNETNIVEVMVPLKYLNTF